MKHVSGLLHKLTAFAAVVVALSGCNRAEYAMLPKTSSYHGTEQHRAVSVAPTPAPETVATEAPAVAPTAPEAVAVQPATPAPVAAVAAPAKAAQNSVAAAPAPRKLTLVERALVSKVAKKADKLSSKLQFKQRTEAASANKISGNLRTGIILLLIGALLGIFGGVIGLIGGIVALIGIVLIILYLLDEI